MSAARGREEAGQAKGRGEKAAEDAMKSAVGRFVSSKFSKRKAAKGAPAAEDSVITSSNVPEEAIRQLEEQRAEREARRKQQQFEKEEKIRLKQEERDSKRRELEERQKANMLSQATLPEDILKERELMKEMKELERQEDELRKQAIEEEKIRRAEQKREEMELKQQGYQLLAQQEAERQAAVKAAQAQLPKQLENVQQKKKKKKMKQDDQNNQDLEHLELDLDQGADLLEADAGNGRDMDDQIDKLIQQKNTEEGKEGKPPGEGQGEALSKQTPQWQAPNGTREGMQRDLGSAAQTTSAKPVGPEQEGEVPKEPTAARRELQELSNKQDKTQEEIAKVEELTKTVKKEGRKRKKRPPKEKEAADKEPVQDKQAVQAIGSTAEPTAAIVNAPGVDNTRNRTGNVVNTTGSAQISEGQQEFEKQAELKRPAQLPEQQEMGKLPEQQEIEKQAEAQRPVGVQQPVQLQQPVVIARPAELEKQQELEGQAEIGKQQAAENEKDRASEKPKEILMPELQHFESAERQPEPANADVGFAPHPASDGAPKGLMESHEKEQLQLINKDLGSPEGEAKPRKTVPQVAKPFSSFEFMDAGMMPQEKEEDPIANFIAANFQFEGDDPIGQFIARNIDDKEAMAAKVTIPDELIEQPDVYLKDNDRNDNTPLIRKNSQNDKIKAPTKEDLNSNEISGQAPIISNELIEKADGRTRSQTQEVVGSGGGPKSAGVPPEPEPADASEVFETDKSSLHDESTINILHTNFNTEDKKGAAAKGSANKKGGGGFKRSLTSVVRLYKEPLDAEKIAIAKGRIRALYPMNDIPLVMLFPSLAKSVHRICGLDINKQLKEMKKMVGITDPEEDTEDAHTPERLAKVENDKNEKVIQGFGLTYAGTNMVKDSKKIHAKEVKQRLGEDLLDDDDDKKVRDPFHLFGHGIQSYFGMIHNTMCLFLVISLMFIPVVTMYRSRNGFDKEVDWLETWTLGNMGHSEASCVHQYVSIDQQQRLHCRVGQIGELRAIGLMPNASALTDEEVFPVDYCSIPGKYKQIDECTNNYLDVELLILEYNDFCREQQSCEINMVDYVKLDDSGSRCNQKYSAIYFQYGCNFGLIEEDYQRDALLVTVIGVVAALLYAFHIFYQRSIAQLDYALWDLQTTTTADFAVEVTFSERVWGNWQTYVQGNAAYFKERKPSFKEYFKYELQKQVQGLEHALNCGLHVRADKVGIATIYFGYNNPDLIHWLKKRGSAYFDENAQEIGRIEKQLTELVAQNKDRYTRPVNAYVTFTNQEGMERCIKYMESEKTYSGQPIWNDSGLGFKLFGEEQEVAPSEEPSNIIWENLHNTNTRLNASKCLNVFLIAIVLLLTLLLIIFMKSGVAIAARRYPDATNCEDIQQLFQGRDQLFREYADRDKEQTEDFRGYGQG